MVQPTRSLDEARAWLAKDVEHWKPIVADAKAMVDKTQWSTESVMSAGGVPCKSKS
jgi:hypothetical protein